MTKENLPAVHNQSFGMPDQQQFQMLQVIAKNAQDSGLYSGVGQQPKILMVLLAAYELGISPMLALNGGIWNIQGKIELSARLMNALIRRAGHSIKIVTSNEEVCTILGTRSDGDSFECTFSMVEASRAGIASGNAWKKYPADMLYSRCMSRLARRLFPDVIGNCYVEGEIQDSKKHDEEEKSHAFKEKNIPLVQYEEIISEETTQKDPVINATEVHEIMKLFVQMDDVSQANCKKYVLDKWSANNFESLPKSAYVPTMTAIQRNLDLNQHKQKAI